MAIIDVHCHILPGVDDGARNVETSLAMLKASSDQGVQYMVATPHFYATRDRVDTFLDRRSEAWETLKPQLSANLPRIYLGAEVAYFQGINRADRLETLRIEGTDCILLEMPFRPWSDVDVDEVTQIYEKYGYTIILAHIERYLGIQGNNEYIEDMLELPVLTQINAEGLLDWHQRRKLIKMLRNGQIHLLGSDCHGIKHRPPNLGEGRDVIRKKIGAEILDRIDRRSEELLLNRLG
jgi:protein-tyrosine phosphatase